MIVPLQLRTEVTRMDGLLMILNIIGQMAAMALPPPPPKAPFTLADLQAQVPKNIQGAFLLGVPDISNSGGDPEVQAVLVGKTVETVGQVMPETANNADGKRLRVVRSLIVCCALHPKQYAATIEFAGKAATLKEMAWVKVVGTVSHKNEDGKTVPIVTVNSFNEIPQPANLMLQ